MQIHRGLEGFSSIQGTVVTSGTFDGVHFGHSRIIKRTIALAIEKSLPTALLTFWPHPRTVIGNGSRPVKLLSTLEEKAALLEQMGIDHLVILPFDKTFSEMTTLEYVHDILINGLRTKYLVIGYDHRFGKNREGGFDFLKERERLFGFQVEEIPKQEIDDVAVSSTKIRSALSEGQIEMANSYLGYEYHLSGIVAKGRQLGRKLGYPTANIEVMDKTKLVPMDGVYAVLVETSHGLSEGMLNIGSRPTVGEGLAKTIEVHILDFEQDLYGEEVKLTFRHFVRKEQKFANLKELEQQLSTDEQAVRAYFA